MTQLFHGAQSGLYLSSPLPKLGSHLCGLQQWLCLNYPQGSSVDTSSPRIQIQVNLTYMSQTQEKPLWSLNCTQALVSISTRWID